eukprot:COSAG02_NODE_2568_length_8511_cov_16.030670_2_plen_320_part_00
MRVQRGGLQVMQYSSRQQGVLLENDPKWTSEHLGIRWPRGAYDSWELQMTPLADLVARKHQGDDDAGDTKTHYGFSTGIVKRIPATTPGWRSADALGRAVCPRGCPETLRREDILWVSSPGVGHQLHYDGDPNVFFHLHGHKQFVLVPPEVMVQQAHLYPQGHPAARQSQLKWSSADIQRTPEGFATPERVRVIKRALFVSECRFSHPCVVIVVCQGDTKRQLDYNQTAELKVYLTPGDVLYLPAFWGISSFGASLYALRLSWCRLMCYMHCRAPDFWRQPGRDRPVCLVSVLVDANSPWHHSVVCRSCMALRSLCLLL